MAHFRGTVEGGRGRAARLGHKKSGLQVTSNAAGCGLIIDASHNEGLDEWGRVVLGLPVVNAEAEVVLAEGDPLPAPGAGSTGRSTTSRNAKG